MEIGLLIDFFKGLAKFPKFKKKKNQDVKVYFPKNNSKDLVVERHRIKIPNAWMGTTKRVWVYSTECKSF